MFLVDNFVLTMEPLIEVWDVSRLWWDKQNNNMTYATYFIHSALLWVLLISFIFIEGAVLVELVTFKV